MSRPTDIEPRSLINRQIGGRYRIEGRLATGGMGAIYHGEHIELGRKVAIKVLSEQFAHNEEAVKRFQREARSSSKIDHPNIVDILDLGRLDSGEPYLVMELLRGEDLADLIARDAPMPLSRVVELLGPVANALDAVHQQGVLHRDIKPANIFLMTAQDGTHRPKLLDFGLAGLREAPGNDKLTREGVVVGTPHYVSPEAAEGEAVDERTDVYSMGVVVFEMLTGLLPIDSDKPMSLLYAKVRKPAPTLSARSGKEFDAKIEQVVSRTLSRTPDKRPASACELIEALREAGNLEPIDVRAFPGSVPPPAAPSSAPLDVVIQPLVEEPEAAAPEPIADEPSAAAPSVDEPTAADTSPEPEPLPEPTPEPQDEVAPAAVPDARPAALPETGSNRALIVAVAVVVTILLAIGAWRWFGQEPDVTPPPTGGAGQDVAEPTDPEATEPEAGEPGATEPNATDPEVGEPGATEPETPPAGVTPPDDIEVEPATQEPRPGRRRGRSAEATEPETTEPEVVADPGADAARALELSREAGVALIQGRFPRARQLYQQATFADSSLAPAWRGLGLASERMGMAPEAVRAYRRYLRIAPRAQDAGRLRQRIEALSQPE